MSEDAFLYEVAPHHDTRGPAAQHGIGRWRAARYLLLAVLLAAGVLLAPLAATVLISLSDGLGHYRVLTDPDVLRALGNSLVWLGLAVLVCAAGFGLAWLARDVGPRLGGVLRVVLVLPAVVSPLTTGAIFRLLFDTNPQRGAVNAVLAAFGADVAFLGLGWIWLVLGLAFLWQWSGVAFLVFHEALARMPASLLRMAQAFGLERRRQIWSIVLPSLAGAASLAYLLAVVAAARVFDLVLMGAPGSMQPWVEPGGQFWWRHHSDLGTGPAAALAVLLSVLVGLLALPALAGLRRQVTWPEQRAAPHGRRSRRRLLMGPLAALWLLPFVVLVLTSLRAPEAAAVSGWWHIQADLRSYGDALADSGFTGALLTTLVRTVVVVALVLLAAVPAAYVLAQEHLVPRRAWRPVLLVAVALAALPPQAFAVPLQESLSRLVGSTLALVTVHAALVIPLAVLVLHRGFARVRAPVMARHRWALVHAMREGSPSVVLAGVLAFVLVWNDTLVGLLLNWPAGDHLPLILLEQNRHFMSTAGTLAAQSVIATAVPVALVIVTRRLLYRGLTGGVRA
ncbi:ABC transporter permease subunit [Nonomuraea harbinensis]|uniref:ABC transporter permease subunit n=1 Tax=Nonomuraea harbinensis TaxID=1286938 RepID=A0ABW1BZD6_9ACTN|nr:ABC transporter permease subunit [Nonomuraea harbinensis]